MGKIEKPKKDKENGQIFTEKIIQNNSIDSKSKNSSNCESNSTISSINTNLNEIENETTKGNNQNIIFESIPKRFVSQHNIFIPSSDKFNFIIGKNAENLNAENQNWITNTQSQGDKKLKKFILEDKECIGSPKKG